MPRDLNAWLLPQNSVGYVVGYRGWYVREGRLVSLCHLRCSWPVGKPLMCKVPLAACNEGGYPLEYERGYFDPEVGIYAYKTHEQSRNCSYHFNVQGAVALWGEIAEHEEGYRAQYAYPLVLTRDMVFPLSEAHEITKLYGCTYTENLYDNIIT